MIEIESLRRLPKPINIFLPKDTHFLTFQIKISRDEINNTKIKPDIKEFAFEISLAHDFPEICPRLICKTSVY